VITHTLLFYFLTFPGTYSDTSEATSCSNCEVGYSSSTGASSCDLAAEDYYILDHLKQSCPKNAVCVGKNQAPVPAEGYWVDRTSYAFMGDIHKCTTATCSVGSQMNGRNPWDACWTTTNSSHNTTQSSYPGSTHCNNDKLLCTEGAEGPLCGSCKTRFTYEYQSKTCKSCTDDSLSFRIILVATAASFLFAVIMIMLHVKHKFLDGAKIFASYISGGSLKVLWVSLICIVMLVCMRNAYVIYVSLL
jgi:hypothetical protein